MLRVPADHNVPLTACLNRGRALQHRVTGVVKAFTSLSFPEDMPWLP